jgi:hypothetical protein
MAVRWEREQGQVVATVNRPELFVPHPNGIREEGTCLCVTMTS